MATLQSKISEAKKAGYSDEEIVKYVSSLPGFESKTQKAINQGYKPSEIVSFLASQSDVKPSAKAEPSDIGQKLFRTSPELTGEMPSPMPATFEEQATPLVEQYKRAFGGLLAGAATVPETIAGAVGQLKYKGIPLPVDIKPGRTLEAVRGLTGAGPEDKAIMLGKTASEIAGTAGVGPLLGVGAKGVAGAEALSAYPGVQKALNALSESLKAGGFSKPDIDNALARFGVTVFGGGATGATTSALMGEDAATGGAMGAAIPVAGKTVGTLVKKGRDILSPQRVTLAEAAGEDMDKLINLLRQNKVIVPGSMPHAGEVTAEAGNPGFSRLVASVLDENTKRAGPVDKKISDMMVQNAVARAQQYQAAFGSAEAAENAILQGLVPSPGTASDDVLNQLKAVAADRMAKAQGAIQTVAGRKTAEATAAEQQQLAALQAARERELGTVGASQQATAAQLQAQQQQQMAALAAQQEAARAAALSRRENRVNQLMAEQEAARNALAAPVQPPAPPAELNALERQRAALEAAKGQVGTELPKVSQMETGKPIVRRAEELAKEAQQTIVKPAYDDYFASHKGTIDITSVADEARDSINRRLDSFDLSRLSPAGMNKVKAYEKALAEYKQAVAQGETGLDRPKLTLSLEDATHVQGAINSEYGALKKSTDSVANISSRQVGQVADALDQSIKSQISKESAELGARAKELAKTKKIEPYDEGIAGLMRQETSLGRERLLPENVAKEVLNTEQAASEFVRAFGKDADSVDNLNTAIQDLYRRKVVQPKGVFDKDAHKKFMDDYGDKLDILDKAGFGIKGALEEQAYTASRLESELGKVTGKIEGINKVQQQQLDMLKQQQAQALQDLTKGQKAALGAAKEEEGKLFGQLSREQKATLGATEKQQRQAFAELSAKQKEELTGIKQKFAEEETAITKKGKAERQFIEQQRKDMAKKAHKKYSSILGYQNVEQMRSKMLSDPARFTEAMPFLNEESKRRLANDIVSDVISKGGDVEKAFGNNQSSLTKILDAAYPGQGKQLVDTLIQRGKTLNQIREIGKESILRPTQPLRMESPEIQNIVKNRRGQFTPDQQADIQALIDDAKRLKTFEDLAKIGSTDADKAATKVLEENTGSKSLLFQSLEKVTSWVNQTNKRLAFIGDEKIRNKLALAAIDPKLMAQLLEEAKAYQKFGKRAGEAFRATGSAAAKVIPVTTNDNRNALAR